ncbi:hypothetical protein AYJ58_13170 [Shewanella sp. Pdp11]|uniref:single-stranded DNA-binding protein n=1 Tax=Shewanella sp. Pdp11 TaxID=2059264 RepID=UPI000CA25CB6|nr:single-stranded DNA-binding protein [Shewanella sp. Pdp11]AUD60368.1 hypothetical protein AYJ58_13125 [Shewanella sp. Pdp11]AUD60376.1 hypothetical protein AYJ58_13170 [Shewanella sp. Pdp11]
MLKIELDAQDCKLEQQTFPSKDGKAPRTIYWQVGYMYTGGRYPVKVQIPLKDGQPAYPAGQYFMHPSSFQANKFNKPEINPFEVTLAPWSELDALIGRKTV